MIDGIETLNRYRLLDPDFYTEKPGVANSFRTAGLETVPKGKWAASPKRSRVYTPQPVSEIRLGWPFLGGYIYI